MTGPAAFPPPRFAPPAADLQLADLGRVHLVGAGGAGMSALAELLLARGRPVSGSDAQDSPTLARLARAGAEVHVGHDPGHVAGADTVVVSSAVRDGNPELDEARRRGLRVLHRAGLLAVLMRGYRAVCVAGTHGKTTTTAMLVVALRQAGADPSFALGGALAGSGEGAHHGSGDLFVAEADESDASFLSYHPDVAVVTNVEPDHLDHYRTPEAVAAAFDAFARQVRPGGFVVACADDPGARRLAGQLGAAGGDVRTYGTALDAGYRMLDPWERGGQSGFTLAGGGHRVVGVRLAVPGRHNARNAAAALTAGLGLGLPAADLRAGLAGFPGTRRRFELRGTAAGVRVYDDYAHHPTEVREVLRAARGVAGGGRLVVAFQPHLYSRTRDFAAEFGAALGLADDVVVLDVYGAREDPLPGVSGALVAAAVPLPGDRVRYVPDRSTVPAELVRRVGPGDLVLTLGAGDVTDLGPRVVALLEAGGPGAPVGGAVPG